MELKQASESDVPTAAKAFNRTLWNWNLEKGMIYDMVGILLIVPYGIETSCIRKADR